MSGAKGRRMRTSIVAALCIAGIAGAASGNPTITAASGEGVWPDVWDTHQGAILLGSTGMSYPATAAFGAVEATNESTHAIFVDYSPPRGVDNIIMQTPRPVTVSGYNLLLMDETGGARAAQHIAVSAFNAANTTLTQLSPVSISTPYANFYGGNEIVVTDHFAPVTAQRWEFDVISAPAPGRDWGTRIVEWDAISPAMGDVNGDRRVGFAELLALAQNYGATNADWAMGDLNGDGRVTFADLLLMAQHYSGTAAVATAPEPVAMLIVVGVGLVRRR